MRDPDGIQRDPKDELPQNRARAEGFPYKTLEPWRDPTGSEDHDVVAIVLPLKACGN